MTFRPYPKTRGTQNVRAKATPGADGKARSTEPRGFKKPTASSLGRAREHRDRPEQSAADAVHAKLFPGYSVTFEDETHVHTQAEIAALGKARRPRASAAGFARATDLAAPAVAEHRRAADPDAPSTRVRPGGSEAGGIWRDQVLALWFPGLTDESDDEIPCPITGLDLRLGWHAHHWIEADVLWQHGLAARVVSVVDRRNGEIVEAPAIWHPFIGVPFADQGHMDFTNGALSVPRHLIPQRMWDLARVLDALDPLAGHAWCTTRLELDYPEAA